MSLWSPGSCRHGAQQRAAWRLLMFLWLFLCFKSSLQLLQLFGRTLQLWFALNLHCRPASETVRVWFPVGTFSRSARSTIKLCTEDEILSKTSSQTIQHLHRSHRDFYLQRGARQEFGVHVWRTEDCLHRLHDSAVFHCICFTTLDRKDISESLELHVFHQLRSLQPSLHFILSHSQGSFHRPAVDRVCVHWWRLVRLLFEQWFWKPGAVSLQRQEWHHTWGTDHHHGT